MNRKLIKYIASLQIGLVLFTGCHPTQPFFIGEDGDMSHYLATATDIEYPDVHIDALPEAIDPLEPLSVYNQDYDFLDLSLEDCISYGLSNSAVIRSLPGSSLQTGDIATALLGNPSQQISTALDPAITSTTANPQPRVVDQLGNRTLPRGATRANQIGGVEDALSEFDAQYSSFISHNTTDRPRNTGLNVFTPEIFVARDTTYQSALSKRMATGGVVTARAQTIYSANNVLAGPTSVARAFPSDYTQALEIQIQHPLMRNRGTLVNRVPVALARLNEDLSLANYEEDVRNFVKDIEVAYWELYFSYWAVETDRLARDAARQAWYAAKSRSEDGGQADYLTAQPEAQLHQFEAALRQSFGGSQLPGGGFSVLQAERNLRMLMGWSPTDGYLVRPIDKPVIARVDYEWQGILAEAQLRNVDIREQKWNIKQKELELISAKNQILPDVNMSGLYRWLGVGDTLLDDNNSALPFPRGPTSAFQGLSSGNYQEVALRLEYTPNAIGARQANALIRNAQLQLTAEHRKLEEKQLALASRLSADYSELASLYVQMTEKLSEWSNRDREIAGYVDKIEVGDEELNRILFQLLQAQQARARTQREYYRSVTQYNQTMVSIHMIKGSLLEYNNITLGEGPWVEKAYWDAEERARERDAAYHLPNGASRPSVFSQGSYNQDQGTADMGQPDVNSEANFYPTPIDENELNGFGGEDDIDLLGDEYNKVEELPALEGDTESPEMPRDARLRGNGMRPVDQNPNRQNLPSSTTSVGSGIRLGQASTRPQSGSSSSSMKPPVVSAANDSTRQASTLRTTSNGSRFNDGLRR